MKQMFPRSFKLAVLAVGATLVVLASLPGCAFFGFNGQKVEILEPANGAVVGSPFKVRFGLKGMAVAPAGDIVKDSGHHHLLIDQEPVPAGESVPMTEKHLHFGKGQTETELKLPPGVYRLTAQFANGAHQSYGKPMSDTITVTVK